MRFGITPIDAENMASIFDKGKGINSFLDFKFSDVVLDAAELGYKHCEITLDIFQILPIPVNDDEIQKLKEIKRDYDITYSAHFPIWTIELSSPNKFIRDASADALIHSYNLFKDLEQDIEFYVIHPTGALAGELMGIEIPEKYRSVILRLFTGFAAQGIKKIIKETKIDKTKILIENIPFPFEGTLEIIKKLRGPKLCLDTGHFLGGYSGDVNLLEITEKYLDLTGEIHLMDYNEKDRDHGALGTGEFPIEFLKIVHEYDFKGPIVFELSFEKAKQSIDFIKKNVPEIEVPEIN
jgi:sugar phosphate isomerase/epimerase